MATFTTRVELLDDPQEGDYKLLHDNMRNMYFYRVIDDLTTKKLYRLPPAEYHSEGNITAERVAKLAEAAVKPLKRRYRILVTEARAIVWLGLDEVKEFF